MAQFFKYFLLSLKIPVKYMEACESSMTKCEHFYSAVKSQYRWKLYETG